MATTTPNDEIKTQIIRIVNFGVYGNYPGTASLP